MRRLRFAFLTLATLAGTHLTAQPPKDAFGDPLPEGAKARLGTDRMRSEFGWPAGVLTPDGKHIIAPKGFKAALIDVTTGRETGQVADYPMILSADGKRAASAAGVVRVWDYPDGKARNVTKRQFSNTAFEPISLSADGKVLAIGAVLNGTLGSYTFTTVLVWDLEADKQLAEITAEQNSLVGVRISPDGKTLATFGRHNDPMRKFDARNPDGWPEQALQLWNAADGKQLARVAVSGRMVVAVAFSPDSALVAVSAGDGLISLRDARTGKEKHQLFGRSYMGTRLAFAPDGKTLAAAARDGRIQRWNVADGALLGSTEPPVGSRPGYPPTMKDLVFTGPDRAVAWGVMGSVAAVWEVPSGKLLSPTSGNSDRVTSVAFSADGKQVLTTAADKTIVRWDASTGKPVGPVSIRPAWSEYYGQHSVLLLRGGTRAVSDRDGSSVYDLTAGTELYRLPVREGTRGPGLLVHTSADGTKAVTRLLGTGVEKLDRYEVWDLVAPKKLGEVEAPPAEWTVASVTTDGTKLFLLTPHGSSDRDLTGYSVATGKKLSTVAVPGALSAVAVPGADPLALVPTKAGKIEVVDFAAGKITATLDGRTGYLGPIAFAPDGKSFAIVYHKDTIAKPALPDEIRVYAWPKGELLHTFTGHSAGVTCLAFSPDGKTLASGSADTSVLLWDLSAPK